MIKFIIAVMVSLIMSCQTLSQKYIDRTKVDSVNTSEPSLESDLINIQRLVTEGQCTEALRDIDLFQKKPVNIAPYIQSVRLLQAECFIQTEDYELAVKNLREIASFSLNTQPKLAAQAFLLLSYAYEGQGNNEKSLSSALDAERFSQNLPSESRLAEVPARLAMLYSQMNDLKQAAAYLMKADEGVRVLRSQNPQILGSLFWARIYYQMGFKSVDQMDSEDIAASIQGLMAVQKFSLKSMEFNEAAWSNKSYQLLQKNYMTLWTLIQKPTLGKSMVLTNDDYQLKDQKTLWLADLLELIRQAKLFQPEEFQPQTILTTNFYSFLNDLEIKSLKMLQLMARRTSMTPESIQLNSSFRAGKVYPTQFFPNEEKTSLKEEESKK